ncbi:MAG: LPS export ABC transporter permease LptG [Azospirillaceae bacterium]
MLGNRTLYRYIARQFLASFIALMVVLTAVVFLFEFVEMVRRVGSRPDATMATAIQLTALKMPRTIDALFHFGVLFSAMFALWRLSRSQELVVARASGVSAWQFTLPIVLAAFAIGAVKIAALDPMAAAAYSRFEAMEDTAIHGRTSVLDLSRGGIWLRQRTDDGVATIVAERTGPSGVDLEQVIVFFFDGEGHFTRRIDAERAVLGNGEWDLNDARISAAGSEAVTRRDHVTMPTDLTEERIRERFASPETLSFWSLPGFIDTLEATGFSSLRHRLHFQSLLADPALFAAMVFLAAAFSLRNSRRGGTLALIVAGILSGFLIFVLSDVVTALGLSENIPIPLAAWTPAAVCLMVGMAGLLHLEDG